MANDRDFQEQVKQLGQMIAEFDQLQEGPQKTACRVLLQLLMEVHGVGLEKMMEIIFESIPAGAAIVDRLGQDSVAGSLLLMHSLHPDDLETRVQRAMERMRPRLRKLSCSAVLAQVKDGAVRVQLTTSGHSCGSSTKDLKAIVEDSVYEFAPDVQSLEVLGLEEASTGGFVDVKSLLGANLASASLVSASANGHALQTEGAD